MGDRTVAFATTTHAQDQDLLKELGADSVKKEYGRMLLNRAG